MEVDAPGLDLSNSVVTGQRANMSFAGQVTFNKRIS